MKQKAALFAAWLLASISADAGQFGTGFAISPKGYLITCHHVVRESERVVVHIGGGYLDATVVATDPTNDLAVLKVAHWPGKCLGLAPSSEISYASDILAAGFPDPSVLGFNPKITTGIVNALSGVRDDPRHIQISAPVQPGNSGGPLVSPSGRVVGIVAAGLNSIDRMAHGGYLPQSVNYAIKSDLVFPLLKSASISVPKFANRVPQGSKQVERTLGAVALIEGLERGERMHVPSRPIAVERGKASGDNATFLASSSNRRTPWVFPESSQRPLSIAEVRGMPKDALWRARNEIYVRHGFVFPDDQGRRFAEQFGNAYRPRTPSVQDIQLQLSPVEVANLRLIADFE
ncbi:MAG TPA: trypsin-like peptidase domain-containing protein [Bacteroidia bacterium]|nr:trypsin-like peptidase domain-containing protein [Bacteroidia bacterium]